MRKSMWTAALLLASLFTLAQPLGLRMAPTASATEAAAPSPQQAPAQSAVQGPIDLDSAIDRWRQALASQSGFELWRDAGWTSYPLGPGTHGFIVLLLRDGQEVGYMIVTATPDGSYRLTEYGTGDKPLFSLSTLYRSLVQQALIDPHTSLAQFLNDTSSKKERLYADPLHAVWKLTLSGSGGSSVYLDAKTGEQLPVDETMLPDVGPGPYPGVDASAAADTVSVADSLLLPAFDPYERISWVRGEPLPLSTFAQVREALTGKERLKLVAEPYGGAITVPLALVGYHVWKSAGGDYAAIDQEGVRYAAYDSLHAPGRLYP